jgi:hypothetical protein
MAGRKARPPAKVYSAPRRFDLATIFVVTLAYSLLLGAMSAMTFPPVASLFVAGFVSLVGIGQAVLFGGARPRTSSVLVGIVLYVCAMLGVWILGGQRMYPTELMLIMASYSLVGGAILGYLAGALVGGVFLVAEKIRVRYSRPATETTEDQPGADQDDSPWKD